MKALEINNRLMNKLSENICYFFRQELISCEDSDNKFATARDKNLKKI